MLILGMVDLIMKHLQIWDIEMTICGIYKIVNKVNGRYYIGSSKDILGRRWKQHQRELNNRTHHNAHLINAWHKYGKDAFEIVVIEEVPIDKLYEVEQKYLDICAVTPSEAYNLNYAPDGGRPSEESIRKISQKLKGRVFTEEHKQRIGQAMVGRPYSDETRAKIGRYAATRTHSEETRRKIGKASLGHRLSDASKLKMSLAGIGRHDNGGNRNPRFDSTIREFIRPESGERFKGTRFDFTNKFRLSAGMVGHMIKGMRETVKGWCIVTPYETRSAA